MRSEDEYATKLTLNIPKVGSGIAKQFPTLYLNFLEVIFMTKLVTKTVLLGLENNWQIQPIQSFHDGFLFVTTMETPLATVEKEINVFLSDFAFDVIALPLSANITEGYCYSSQEGSSEENSEDFEEEVTIEKGAGTE